GACWTPRARPAARRSGTTRTCCPHRRSSPAVRRRRSPRHPMRRPSTWRTSHFPRTSMPSWRSCSPATARSRPRARTSRAACTAPTTPAMIGTPTRTAGTTEMPGAEPAGAGSAAPAAPATALAELERAEAAVSGPALARQYRELLRANPRALHRDGGPRHLTASAIVIDGPGDHVALVWHRKGRFWVQPGGHLEPGETSFAQAARREVAEEIG